MDRLRLPLELSGAIDDFWAHLGSPGASYDAAQRLQIADVARAARHRSTADAPSDAARSAAATISTAAGTVRRQFIDDLVEEGLTYAEYVEILGIVSMLSAVDTLDFGVGNPQRPLPEPTPGAPTGEIDASAAVDGGWVPTVGAAFPTTALSLTPAEAEAWHHLHGALYLSLPQMAQLDIVRDGASRAQMEAVAARTSLINDCFF